MFWNFFIVLANFFNLNGLILKLFKQTVRETQTNDFAHVLENLNQLTCKSVRKPRRTT